MILEIIHKQNQISRIALLAFCKKIKSKEDTKIACGLWNNIAQKLRSKYLFAKYLTYC